MGSNDNIIMDYRREIILNLEIDSIPFVYLNGQAISISGPADILDVLNEKL